MKRNRKLAVIIAAAVFLGAAPVTAQPAEDGGGPAAEEMRMEAAGYTDRFIVRYAQGTQAALDGPVTAAYDEAKLRKSERLPEWNIANAGVNTLGLEEEEREAMPAEVREALTPQRAQAQRKPVDGGETILLQEKVDPETFITALMENSGGEIDYVQPDYILRQAAEEDMPSAQAPAESIASARETPGPDGEAELEDPPEQTVEVTVEQPEPAEPSAVGPQEVPGGMQVSVAVIDGGVDVTHPALQGRLTDGYDFCHDTVDLLQAPPTEMDFHGTHIAGTIAAGAPDAAVMPLRVFEGGQAYTSDIIRAIGYAKEHGAQIVNCSWGGGENNQALLSAMEASGLFFVCAAGNQRRDVDETPVYPACFGLAQSVSVASLNDDLGMSYFSNFGVERVDIAAPGRDVSGPVPGGGYDTMSGTSVSAAVVTGAAAQYAKVYGTQQMKESLSYSADKLSSLEGRVRGNAGLNAQRLLACEEGQVLDVQAAEDFDALALALPVEDRWQLFLADDNVQAETGFADLAVLKRDGSVWSRGYDGGPEQVAGLKDIIAIAGTYDELLALDRAGKVYIWNGYGSDAAMEKEGLRNVAAVTCGDGQKLALKKDGTVWGWGENYFGQAGYGESRVIETEGGFIFDGFESSYTPAQVKKIDDDWTFNPLTDIVKIAAGNMVSWAIDSSGTLWQWGQKNRQDPNDCLAEVVRQNVSEVTGDGDSILTIAVNADGTVTVYPSNLEEFQTYQNPVFQNAVMIEENTVLKKDGTVWRWSPSNPSTPAWQISGLSNIVSISDKVYLVCVKSDGTLWRLDSQGNPYQFRYGQPEPEGTLLVSDQFNAEGNPAYHQNQNGLEALGWSEFNQSYKSENNWQTPSMGEFTAESGTLIVKKTAPEDQPSGATAQALVYAVDKVFTVRQDNWQGNERTSLWKQNFKGNYEIEFKGMFQQMGGQVYYDIMGRSGTGVPGVVGRYQVNPYTTGTFNVYNDMLNGAGIRSYPLWTNSQIGRTITTALHSSDSTFQTYLDGNVKPCETTVEGAFPKDVFSMSGWSKAQPGAYITGIRISAQKQAHKGDTIAKINGLSLREISKTPDITDTAAQQLNMSLITGTPEAVRRSLSAPPAEIAGIPITWSSSHPQYLTSHGGYIAQPVYDTDVTLTAKLTNPADQFTQYLDFRLTLPGSSGRPEPAESKVLIDEQYAKAENSAYHLDQQGLEALGWSALDQPNKTGNNWQTPSLGSFSAASGKLAVKKTGSTGEPSGAPAQALVYSLDRSFTYRQDKWKGDPHMSVWTNHFKGDYDVELTGAFTQTGSHLYYDLLGNSAAGQDTVVGRYAVSPGVNGTFSVYNNKLNGGTSTSYPLWTDPGQTRTVKTSLYSATSTFQTFLNGAASPSQTTAAEAKPKDTFSMSGWSTAKPGAYLKGIRISVQKSAPAGDTAAVLDSLKLTEVSAAHDMVDDALELLSVSTLTDTPDLVVENLKPLPSTLAGAQITWSSSRPELMSSSGEILQSVVFDEPVVMTAKITNPSDGFTKYADFSLRLVKREGFAQRFSQDVTGEPSHDGQPGQTSLPEIEGWTFRYPGISNGASGQTHDSQVLVRDGALIFKKISDRQTDNYQVCLEGERPLSRTQASPKWEGKYDLEFKARAHGTGAFWIAPVSGTNIVPFRLKLDASAKTVTVVYGKQENGNWQEVQQVAGTIDATVEHTYRLSIDTTGSFAVYIDGQVLETEEGSSSRGFLPGTGSYWNLSKLRAWITNITFANTEMGFLKDIVFSPSGGGGGSGTDDAPPAQIQVPVEGGADVTVKVMARGVKNLNQTTFTVTYDSGVLEAVDLAGQVYGDQTQPGDYGNIEIVSAGSGSVSFRVKGPVTHPQQRWTGVLNILRLRALQSGNANVEVHHE